MNYFYSPSEPFKLASQALKLNTKTKHVMKVLKKISNISVHLV